MTHRLDNIHCRSVVALRIFLGLVAEAIRPHARRHMRVGGLGWVVGFASVLVPDRSQAALE